MQKQFKVTLLAFTIVASCVSSTMVLATGFAPSFHTPALAVMPQDVGVATLCTRQCEQPEVLVTNYEGGASTLKNGDMLILSNNTLPATLEKDAQINLTFSTVPVEGFVNGQTLGIGHFNGDDVWIEDEVIKVKNGTVVEYTIPQTGNYTFYLQSYCTDTIYFDEIALELVST